MGPENGQSSEREHAALAAATLRGAADRWREKSLGRAALLTGWLTSLLAAAPMLATLALTTSVIAVAAVALLQSHRAASREQRERQGCRQ